MTTPSAFTIHREAAGTAVRWSIETDPRFELLWLPIIGPTPFAILRTFDRELADAVGYFEPITMRVADLADRVGTKVGRAWQSLLRLERAGLISRDLEVDRFEHPVFVVDRSVRPLGDAEWARLPARLRSKYSTADLG